MGLRWTSVRTGALIWFKALAAVCRVSGWALCSITEGKKHNSAGCLVHRFCSCSGASQASAQSVNAVACQARNCC